MEEKNLKAEDHPMRCTPGLPTFTADLGLLHSGGQHENQSHILGPLTSSMIWEGDTSSGVPRKELQRILPEHLPGALLLYVFESKGELCESGVVVMEVSLVGVKEGQNRKIIIRFSLHQGRAHSGRSTATDLGIRCQQDVQQLRRQMPPRPKEF